MQYLGHGFLHWSALGGHGPIRSVCVLALNLRSCTLGCSFLFISSLALLPSVFFFFLFKKNKIVLSFCLASPFTYNLSQRTLQAVQLSEVGIWLPLRCQNGHICNIHQFFWVEWLKNWSPVPTLPGAGAWRYRASAGTGWPGVSVLWLGEVERLICSYSLSVAARRTVWANPSLRYTSMLLGR